MGGMLLSCCELDEICRIEEKTKRYGESHDQWGRDERAARYRLPRSHREEVRHCLHIREPNCRGKRIAGAGAIVVVEIMSVFVFEPLRF
jgi:hypothetical protein